MSTGPRRADRTILCLLLLTFGTGVADAVGYLALDRVFVGNMTGNVVILGMATVGGAGLPVTGPALAALVGFFVGALGAGWVSRSGRQTRLSRRLAIQAAVLALVGLGLALAPASSVRDLVVSTVIAVVMGWQAGIARQLAVKDLTTVVVTSTLTALAGSAAAGWAQTECGENACRILSVTLLTAGAVCGAALNRADPALGVGLTAVITLFAAGILRTA